MTDSPLLPRRTVSRPSHAWNPTSSDGGERRPQDRAAVAVVAHGEDREAEDLEADDRGDRAVDPLDPGLRVVERRQELAVAERPVGAAQAGIGRPHDHADVTSRSVVDDGGSGELLEAGHGRAHSTVRLRRLRVECATPVAMAALAPRAASGRLLVAACGGGRAPLAPSPAAAARLARHRPRRRLDVRARTPAIPPVSSRQLAPGRRPATAIVFSFLDPATNLAGRLAGSHGVGRVLRPRPRRSRATATDGDVRLGDRGRARHLRRERRPSRGRRLEARVHDRGAGLARRRRSA